MKANKRRFLFFLVFALVVTAFFLSVNQFQPEANAEDDELDKLFKEMGIGKIDSRKEPVDFSLVRLDAKIIRLSEYQGKIVFLNFWATWCAPCRIEMPAMQKLHDKYKDQNFAMIAVSLKENVQQVRSYIKKNKLTFTILVDPKGKAAQQFRVISIPTTIIINKQGIIIGHAIGPRTWESKKSFALFKKLIEME